MKVQPVFLLNWVGGFGPKSMILNNFKILPFNMIILQHYKLAYCVSSFLPLSWSLFSHPLNCQAS